MNSQSNTGFSIDSLKGKNDFRFIEEWILNFLAQGLVNQTAQPDNVREWIEARKTGYWFDAYRSVYSAMEHANELLGIIQSATWNFESADAAVNYYAQTGFKGNYHYRKFM